jgi:hypothetical protein
VKAENEDVKEKPSNKEEQASVPDMTTLVRSPTIR